MAADTKAMTAAPIQAIRPVALSLLVVAVLTAACTGAGEVPASEARPLGDPAIDRDALERHMEQFENDLPLRQAGSQQEFAAASYLTGHLQQAGYLVNLDPVPVGDLVRSTNVEALAPSGGDPAIVVTVTYDNDEMSDTGDEAPIAAFLEVARALRVVEEQHNVAFVALGAQHATESGGGLGSKRLAQSLIDAEAEPEIIYLSSAGESLSTGGTFGHELIDIACPRCRARSDGEEQLVPNPEDAGDPVVPFDRAGFDWTIVSGPSDVVAEALLKLLSRPPL